MIQITADTRRAVVTNKELLTVGSAGIQVQFTLSEDWDTLSKLAVFRVGDDGTKVDMALGESLTCVVPPEVLMDEGEVLFIGVYGANGQGTVIIPTVWASAGVVKPGTEPETPASAEPTPEIWAQILSVANDAEQTATEAMSIVEDAITHTPIIQDGYWYFWNEDAQEYQSTGIKAEGEDGTSPTITVVDIEGGHRVIITDVDHPQGQTIDVMNGTNGTDGNDGYSPVVTVTNITGGHRVTITDKTHPSGQSFDVMDGVIQSVNGKSAASITIDSGDIEFDDSETYAAGSIGAEVSNQKNAINQKAPLIINSASGDIASFADGADGMPIKKVVGTIVPVQSGTGNPSPDNVRPISGWTGANITQVGANIWGGTALRDGIKNSITSGYSETDETCSWMYSSGARGAFASGIFKENTQYTFILTGNVNITEKDFGNIQIQYTDGSFGYPSGFTTSKSTVVFVSAANKTIKGIYKYNTEGAATTTLYFNECGVFEGVLTASGFVPYVSQTIPINWQDEAGTIFGGTVTLNEDGSATVIKEKVLLEVTPQWTVQARDASLGIYQAYIRDENYKTPLNPVSNMFAFHDNWNPADGCFSVRQSGAYTYFNFRNNQEFPPNDLDGVRATLAEFYNTGTPVTFTNDLATPEIITLENVGSLYTYLGTNNVWIDTGAITECDYPADTKLYIDGLTAPDEDMIADANIASGKYFVVNNQLYLSTAAIAAGASIVPGTNCTATNLAEALNALNT